MTHNEVRHYIELCISQLNLLREEVNKDGFNGYSDDEFHVSDENLFAWFVVTTARNDEV